MEFKISLAHIAEHDRHPVFLLEWSKHDTVLDRVTVQPPAVLHTMDDIVAYVQRFCTKHYDRSVVRRDLPNIYRRARSGAHL